MANTKELDNARSLIADGRHPEARKILETIKTNDPKVRLDVLLAFLVVLDHVTENDRLLEVATEGITVATNIGNDEVRTYLMARKSIFLLTRLSSMVHRQKNLMLSANVFEWIDFSLERDKKEYEAIVEMRKPLEKEIDSLIKTVIDRAERGIDHYFRGHLFSAIGDFFSSQYLNDLLDFQKGGKTKSRIANLYFVRRWNLDRFLYDRTSRKRIADSKKKCIQYFERSIDEFRLGDKKSDEANATYNLAVKMKLFYTFGRARGLLAKAKSIALELQEKPLLQKIELLEKEVADKNRHMRNYVTEMGLDMP
jgi:hypothetical protein